MASRRSTAAAVYVRQGVASDAPMRKECAHAPLPAAVLGIDVGGTKVAAALIDGSEAAARRRAPDRARLRRAVIAGIVAAAHEVIARAGAQPAASESACRRRSTSPPARSSPSVNIPLEGVALGRELTTRLGVPVYVDNDANCAGLAEAHLGPRRQPRDVHARHRRRRRRRDRRPHLPRRHAGSAPSSATRWSSTTARPARAPARTAAASRRSARGTALEREAAAVAKDFPDSPLGRAAESGKARGRDVVAAARGAATSTRCTCSTGSGCSSASGSRARSTPSSPRDRDRRRPLARVAISSSSARCEAKRSRALPKLAERVRDRARARGRRSGAPRRRAARASRAGATRILRGQRPPKGRDDDDHQRHQHARRAVHQHDPHALDRCGGERELGSPRAPRWASRRSPMCCPRGR